MLENNFKVIKGGVSEDFVNLKHVFISSYVTDTRLMGAVVLHFHWKLMGEKIFDQHQFFYYDPEEDGLETYKSVLGNDFASIKAIENSLLGGLGSNKVSLSECEARFLFNHYANTNFLNNKPFPLVHDEYKFLFDESVFSAMTLEDKNKVISKTYTAILSENHSINYFLMRAFAKDETAVKVLANKSCNIADYLKYSSGSADLCKNTIEPFNNESGVSYLCESLTEENNNYKIAVSELTLGKSHKIKTAKILSYFSVSMAEAAMMMAKPEYVSCYDIIDLEDTFPEEAHKKFVEKFYNFVRGCLSTDHDDGSLFIVFNDNNMHVNRSEYRLNDDLYCIYYISNFDQLIVTAYNSEVIKKIEQSLEQSKVGQNLLPLSKYQFKEPMVYEFIQSDFDDFEEFVEAVLYNDQDE